MTQFTVRWIHPSHLILELSQDLCSLFIRNSYCFPVNLVLPMVAKVHSLAFEIQENDIEGLVSTMNSQMQN